MQLSAPLPRGHLEHNISLASGHLAQHHWSFTLQAATAGRVVAQPRPDHLVWIPGPAGKQSVARHSGARHQQIASLRSTWLPAGGRRKGFQSGVPHYEQAVGGGMRWCQPAAAGNSSQPLQVVENASDEWDTPGIIDNNFGCSRSGPWMAEYRSIADTVQLAEPSLRQQVGAGSGDDATERRGAPVRKTRVTPRHHRALRRRCAGPRKCDPPHIGRR